MGSKGAKPRKGKRTRHLAKVGSATENERLLHQEQRAVVGNVGMGAGTTWVKVALAVGAVLLIAAIVALVVTW